MQSFHYYCLSYLATWLLENDSSDKKLERSKKPRAEDMTRQWNNGLLQLRYMPGPLPSALGILYLGLYPTANWLLVHTSQEFTQRLIGFIHFIYP